MLDRHLVLLVGFAAALGGCEQNSSPAPGRVEWAVELPPTIASELADYVNMEFGGMPGYPIDANNLSYVGEFTINGTPTKYWSYPCAEQPECWVVVTPWEDGYLVGPGRTPPPVTATPF